MISMTALQLNFVHMPATGTDTGQECASGMS